VASCPRLDLHQIDYGHVQGSPESQRIDESAARPRHRPRDLVVWPAGHGPGQGQARGGEICGAAVQPRLLAPGMQATICVGCAGTAQSPARNRASRQGFVPTEVPRKYRTPGSALHAQTHPLLSHATPPRISLRTARPEKSIPRYFLNVGFYDDGKDAAFCVYIQPGTANGDARNGQAETASSSEGGYDAREGAIWSHQNRCHGLLRQGIQYLLLHYRATHNGGEQPRACRLTGSSPLGWVRQVPLPRHVPISPPARILALVLGPRPGRRRRRRARQVGIAVGVCLRVCLVSRSKAIGSDPAGRWS